MSIYVQEYSDILVEELTHREEQIREKDMKNKFISTLLAVQSRIRSLQQGKARKNTASALTGKVLANVCYCMSLSTAFSSYPFSGSVSSE